MLAVNEPLSDRCTLPAMVQCFAADDRDSRYAGRIEKVKFGVPVVEALAFGIPATLLVLLLRVNKLGPLKKDIWRAPGNQAHVRKLIQFMQHGRLINVEHFSVYTAASVIKKFLSKLPGGIFGPVNEELLFNILNCEDLQKRREAVCRVLSSLSVPCQHLLVLLIGTFRLITDAASKSGTRMSAEAIGLSVAPSLFHTCIYDGQRAQIEDVIRFRNASKVLTFIVENFGFANLFPRENYEFYAKITGRTLRVETNWRFTFLNPSITFGDAPDGILEHRVHAPKEATRHTYDCGRSVFAPRCNAVSLDELKDMAWSPSMAGSTSNIDRVYKRQTMRMQTRSEWFLAPMLAKQDVQTDTSSTVRRKFQFFGNALNSVVGNQKSHDGSMRMNRRSRLGRPSSTSSLLQTVSSSSDRR